MSEQRSIPEQVGSVGEAREPNAATVFGGNAENRSDRSGNTPVSPIALNLIQLMEQARENVHRRGFSEFYPQFWMYDKIVEVTAEMSDRNNEVSNALAAVERAYGIVAYPQFTPRQKDQFRQNLRRDIRDLNIGTVTLDERQRELLTHITAATNTPFNPDQTEYAYATILQQPDFTEEELEQDPRYDTW